MTTSKIPTLHKTGKYCPRCQKVLPLEMFGKSKKTKDGHTCYCKEHCNEMTKESYAKNAEIIRERRRERYARTKAGQVKEYKKRGRYKKKQDALTPHQAAKMEQARRLLIAIGFIPAAVSGD
jgi:uncharacterized radical SAM superfamily Fe-S cluster-containing enzyme